MPPKKRSITAKTLQTLLTRIGSASSGTKATLQARFLRDLQVSRGFGGGERREREIEEKRGLRIVSVDMGIKNLAFCVARVEFLETKKEKEEGGDDDDGGKEKGKWDAVMHIERWEKIDLLGAGKTTRPSDVEHKGQDKNPQLDDGLGEEVEDPFSPSSLSHTAYSLISSTLLPARPDIILIEKQRWRSGGGNAVLQWTVRVNTLEAMLWAVLTSVREERRRRTRHPVEKPEEEDMGEEGFEIWAVDPKRVGQFWIGGQPKQLTQDEQSNKLKHEEAEVEEVVEVQVEAGEKEVQEKEEEKEEEEVEGEEQQKKEEEEEKKDNKKKKNPRRAKAEKRAKIALLQSWLASSPPSSSSSSSSTSTSTSTSTPKISFHIHPPATPTLAALTALATNITPRQRTATPRANETEIRKLDDVTDCFLQAAAWVAWEANRRAMVGVWNASQGQQEEEVREGGLSGDVVREMLGE